MLNFLQPEIELSWAMFHKRNDSAKDCSKDFVYFGIVTVDIYLSERSESGKFDNKLLGSLKGIAHSV